MTSTVLLVARPQPFAPSGSHPRGDSGWLDTDLPSQPVVVRQARHVVQPC